MHNGKMADLAGPGIGNYKDLEKILPSDYSKFQLRHLAPSVRRILFQ